MNYQPIPSVALAAALVLSPATVFADPTPQEQAGAAVRAFATALKGELMTAMQSGGPVAAIDVCKVEAPQIAEAVSLERGMQLSRVSQRNRNPHNAPNDWQAVVLEDFQERVNGGEDAAGLSWQQTVETETGAEYRFMKAIPTGAVCLACHGQVISPDVAAKIEQLYPGDKATGFSEGDLRGAFVVTKTLD